MSAKLLVVEDEAGIRDFLERGLSGYGYHVDTAADGPDGAAMALSGDYDLVVLDLLLPGRSGMSVLDELRRNRPNLPVILLTALGELEDRITGLDAGATDYIVKPFSVAELAARIRAHLRAISDTPTTIHAGDLELDLIERRVRRSGRQVHLSSTEFQLLAYFVRNAGRVITRTQLLQAVWGYQHDPGTNTVEVYVGYLRRKLQLDGRELPLVTIRAVGYRLDAET